jgi:predicted nucleotidyltransferase
VTQAGLEHLTSQEQQAVLEFVRWLQERFGDLVQSAWLFGSKARGDSAADSDIDVLVVVDSEDWRIHKQVRYIAADICLMYDLNLSPRVWSDSHLREMKELQTLLYQNVRRDGVNLLDRSPLAG